MMRKALRAPVVPRGRAPRDLLAGPELTSLQSMAVLAVLLLLTAVAVDTMRGTLARAEQARLTADVASIRSALMLHAMTRLVAGETDAVVVLDGSNPFAGVLTAPANYRGALDAPAPEHLEPGTWVFDRRTGTLVYRVVNEARFQTVLEGPKRARFRVRVLYGDADGDGAIDAGVDGVEGITLVALEPYAWRA